MAITAQVIGSKNKARTVWLQAKIADFKSRTFKMSAAGQAAAIEMNGNVKEQLSTSIVPRKMRSASPEVSTVPKSTRASSTEISR